MHLRVAQGETLSPEEQSVHEAGRQAMYAEEKLGGDIEELRETRSEMLTLKARYNEMRARYEAMESEVAMLEAGLSASTRQLLGVGD